MGISQGRYYWWCRVESFSCLLHRPNRKVLHALIPHNKRIKASTRKVREAIHALRPPVKLLTERRDLELSGRAYRRPIYHQTGRMHPIAQPIPIN